MNRIIDENSRCQYCNCKLKVTPKDIGQPAICVDCRKKLFKWRLLFFILSALVYGLLSATLLSMKIYAGAIPTLIILLALFFASNYFSKKITMYNSANNKKKIKTNIPHTTTPHTNPDTISDDSIEVNQKKQSDESTNKTDKEELKPKKTKYCKQCGSKIDYNTKKCTGCGKQYFKLHMNKTTIILSAIVLALVVLNIFQFVNLIKKDEIINEKTARISNSENLYDDLLNSNSRLKKQKERIKKKYRKISDAYDFYHEYSAIVYDDGSKKYHTYECPKYIDTDIKFYIYNTNWAEQEGYKPCRECHKNDDDIYTLEDYRDDLY